MGDIIVTDTMVEDLLHRNKVDIKHAEEDIKKFNERIKKREERIEYLLKTRTGLLEALEKIKRDEKK